MKHHRRSLAFFIVLAFLVGLGWLCVYAYDQGITKKWKSHIIAELEKQGIYAEIGRITLDPVNGLTARDVRLFDTMQRAHHLAEINHISLDVDLARAVEGKSFLRTLDLRNAYVRLSVDPNSAAAGVLEIKDLNARLHFHADRVDVTRAGGVFSGVRVNVRGSIDLPKAPDGTPEEMERRRRERKRQIEEMNARRGTLREVVRFLEKFSAPGPQKATLDVELNGPLYDFAKLHAVAALRAQNLTCGEFTAEHCEIEVVVADGEVNLRRLEIQDRYGALRGQAEWRPDDSNTIHFWVDSAVDLHALAKAVFPHQVLNEVVFYAPPPRIKGDGKFFLGEPFTAESLPLEFMARVDTKRFTTHGVIFDGFHGDLWVKRDEFFARNLILEHHSGSTTAKFMKTKDAGFRYHVKWNMELNAALPFLANERAREWLADFHFDEKSFISIEAEGAGPSLMPNTWTGSALLDLRHFSHRDVEIGSLTAGVTQAGPKRVLRNVVVKRPDGYVTVDKVMIDQVEQTYGVENLVCTADAALLARCIDRRLAANLKPYDFAPGGRLDFSGIISALDETKTDFMAKISAPKGVTLDVAGESRKFTGVSGTVARKQDRLLVNFVGTAPAGSSMAGLTCLQPTSVTYQGNYSVGLTNKTPDVFSVAFGAVDNCDLAFAGKQLPLINFVATVKGQENAMTVEANARLLGGSLNAQIALPDVEGDDLDGKVSLTGVDFGRLAKIFDSTRSTKGSVSGELNFTAKKNRGDSIVGTGKMTLKDGDVFAIPLLGPLSMLVNTVLPIDRLTYSVADRAEATFSVADGAVTTKDFEALTPTFRLKISGVVDYHRDQLDLTAQMNMRGAPGLLLTPVSKLLEYEARNTMKEPGWQLKHVGIPFLRDDAPKNR